MQKLHQTSPTSEKQASNNADKIYLDLVKDIIENGHDEPNSRTGVGTRAVFGRQIRFKMSEGLPLITLRKMYAKAGIYELLWFLGNHLNDPKYAQFNRSNIKYLVDNNVNIWVGDVYKAYTTKTKSALLSKDEFIERIKTDDRFAKEYGNCGPIYGVQWRKWGYGEYTPGSGRKSVDQLAEAIHKLKNNPTDRRIMVSAWNVEDLKANNMVLPPCHYGFTFFTRLLTLQERIDLLFAKEDFDVYELTRGKKGIEIPTEHTIEICNKYDIPTRALSLKWNQRSVDVPLGLGVNILSYAMLLEMIAKEVNMVAEDLIGSLENTHIYSNQMEGIQELLTRESKHALPKLWLNPDKSIFDYTYDDIKIVGYESQGKIDFPLSN